MTALLLALAAAGTWLLAGEPARRQRDRLRADYARAREERQQQRVQLAILERRLAPTQPGPAGARALRRALLEATRDLRLRGIAIDVRGDARSVARGQLRAEGSSFDALELADRLAGPASGVALQRLELVPVPDQSLVVRFSAEVAGAGDPK